MKKSKIIVPALSLILLSTVASVSGTVAWFSANRAVTVTTTDFAVTKLDGDLTAVVSAGEGTIKVNDQKVGIKTYTVDEVTKSYSLTDASYNKDSDMLYTKTLGSDDTVNGYKTICSLADALDETKTTKTWVASEVSHAYYAISWTITFTNDGGAANSSLFFNTLSTANGGSSVTNAKQAGATEKSTKTYNAFRIAFICGTRMITWAPNHTVADTTSTAPALAKTTNVTGTALANVANETNCVAPGSVSTLADVDTSSNHSARADYLGTFTKTGDASPTLAVKCVAWYEGTDESLVNEAELDQVSASLKFYARNQQ